MAEVSGPQFGKVLKNTLGGGDSINVVTGNRPTRGFMVSDEGSETRVRAEDMSVDKITRHVDKHAGTLRTDPEAHLGTWRDARYSEAGKMVPSPNDTVYMDVSRRHDSPFMAYNAGLRENQLAIYDVSAQDTIPIRHDLTRRAQRRMSPHVERGM